MSDYNHRGRRSQNSLGSDGFSFWTNSLFGHQINGVWGPSVNVAAENTSLNASVSFSHVGDSGDETPERRSAKQLFLEFITHPKVYEPAMRIIQDKLGGIARIQIGNFIDREMREPRTTRPAFRRDPMDTLRLIAQGDAPKN